MGVQILRTRWVSRSWVSAQVMGVQILDPNLVHGCPDLVDGCPDLGCPDLENFLGCPDLAGCPDLENSNMNLGSQITLRLVFGTATGVLDPAR